MFDYIVKKYYHNARALFTDGWNSFWHFLFGWMSIYFVYIIPIFVVYQLKDIHDNNLFVDLLEFFLGLVCGIAFMQNNGVTNGKIQLVE